MEIIEDFICPRTENGWSRYADFIDCISSFFAKQSQYKHIEHLIPEVIAENNGDNNSIVNQLYHEKSFRSAIKDFVDHAFPIQRIIEENSKDQNKAEEYYELALESFNQSMFDCALFQLSDAMRFLDFSLSDNDPKLSHHIHELRAKCFRELGKYDECLATLVNMPHKIDELSYYSLLRSVAIEYGDDWDLNRLDLLQAVIDLCRDKINKPLDELIDLIKTLEKSRQENAKPNVESRISQWTSSKDQLVLDIIPNKNRCYKAKSDINIGEVIFREKPHALHFLSQTNFSYCGYCLKNLSFDLQEKIGSPLLIKSFAPCTGCNKFIFCNEECRKKAMKQFHEKECRNMSMMFAIESHIGIAYLVARIVSINREEFLETIKQGLDFIKNIGTGNMVFEENQTPYSKIQSLLTHGEKHDVKTQICFLLGAFFLEEVFKKFSFLIPSDEASAIAMIALLVKHLQQLSTNAVIINEKTIERSSQSPSIFEKSLAVGLYIDMAMFNHSCDPDVNSIFIDDELLFRTRKSISDGKEICCSYGPLYTVWSYSARQKYLKEQYFFTCDCYACENKIETYANALLCPKCNGPALIERENEKYYIICRNQHRADNVREIFKKVPEAIMFHDIGLRYFINALTDQDLVMAISFFYRADVIYSNVLYRCNVNYLRLKDVMVDCYLKMGHYDRAAIYSRQIISTYDLQPFEEGLPAFENRLRLVKILWLIIEETEESNIDKICELKQEIRSLLLACRRKVAIISESYEIANSIDLNQELEAHEKRLLG